MVAYQLELNKFGQPTEEGVVSLVKKDIPTPGPGQVVVKIKYACLHPSDMFAILGGYMGAKVVRNQGPFPSPLGSESAGIVETLGEGVTHLQLGQKVMPPPESCTGTWTTHYLADAARCIPLPDALPLEKSCQAFVNPLTILAMFDELGIKKGEWFVQSAANSTLGRLAIEVAKARGYKSVNLVRRPELVDDLKSSGADEVIVTTKENIPKRIKEITAGQGVKYFLDAVAGPTAAEVIQSLSVGSTTLVYGGQSQKAIPLGGGDFVFKDPTVKAFWLTTFLAKDTDGSLLKKLLGQVFELMLAGVISPRVDRKFGLHEYREALREQYAGQTGRLGKLLFDMDKTTEE